MSPEVCVNRRHGGNLDVAWTCDIGRLRESNQDAAFADPDRGLLIVSDGMGGGHAGGLASFMIVDRLPDLLGFQLRAAEREDPHNIDIVLRDAIVELNHVLRDEGSEMEGTEPLGATVVLACVRGDLAHVAHMGDSRAYLFRSGALEQLTQDHTSVNVLLSRGAIGPEDAEYHPLRGKLSRFVGMGGDARADIRSVDFRAGDELLLCSDGLTDALANDRIAAILGQTPDIADACRSLAATAKETGARDNITVLIARRIV